jgi:translation initiation factor IF-3
MLCRASEVRVLDRQKEMVGVMPLNDALDMADDQGQDLILIAGDAQPPLVRICAASTFKYEIEKNKKVANKKQRENKQELKELKMTPRTEIHDLEVRLLSCVACVPCMARYRCALRAHALYLSAHKLRCTLGHTQPSVKTRAGPGCL